MINNVVYHLLGITFKGAKWAYINRKGHVIHCTHKQYISYLKKKKALTHEQVMARAIDTIFAPNPMYKYLHRKGRV